MSRYILSCDPGSKGFLCAYDRDEGTREYLSIADSTKTNLAVFVAIHKDAVAVMEEVHAIYGSSAKATFSFGEIFGFLQGLFVANGIPYVLVPPKKWQMEVWINSDKVFESGKKVDTKKTSINAALRLFPAEDFRRTEKCKTIDDNKVDATLIAEYARRRNL